MFVAMSLNQCKQAIPTPSQEDLDSLLTLEDSLYANAYSRGVSDGALAGRIEGRIFGLEKGFEKFAALGELHGRSVVWASRVLEKSNSGQVEKHPKKELSTMTKNPRLINNVTLLHSLTDPETFSTDNTEEAVADFDDRFKRAGAKAKVIERILGEGNASHGPSVTSPRASPARGKTGNMNIEGQKAGKGDASMEDFAGSRLIR